MGRRRLLILCYFYPPLAGGGVHRVLGFTRYLPDHGWDCSVVCAGEEDYWVSDASLLRRVPERTEVIRVRGGSALSMWLRWARGPGGRRAGRTFAGLRRWSDWWLLPDSYVGWAARARAAAARRLARGDCHALLSSSPPDSVQLAALALKRRFGLPWVADFRDPWVGLTFRDPPTAWHRRRQAGGERTVLETADRVLVASRTHAARLGERSGTRIPGTRVIHLPNGYETDPAAASGAAPATGASGAFTLVFTGTLALMPDTEVLLEALHHLLARRPELRRRLRTRLIGPFESGYADRATALGLTGIVEFTGPLAHAESRAWQRRADVLLLWKPRGVPTMVPGKLYEYLDAGRPLLALLEAEDEAAALVREAGGTVLPPGDAAAAAAWIETEFDAWRAGGRAAVARPAWLDAHRREHLSGRLARVLDELAGNPA